MKRKIAVFTGNRAEYGLQKPILEALKERSDVEYQLIVSGAHLDAQFGKTLDGIQADGYRISATPSIQLEKDDLHSTARAIGSGIVAMVDTYEKLKPDLAVVYADRFEGFAALVAATQMNIPTAHIEGGDLTEGGALDDSVRHAMSKLAHLHFTTNEDAKRRLIAMGEEDWRVFNTGLPVLDLIRQGKFAPSVEVIARYKLDSNRPVVIFTQHSVTTEFEEAKYQIDASIVAMRSLARDGVQFIVTYPNNDAGGVMIISRLKALLAEGITGIQMHPSLGANYFYGALHLAKSGMRVACVGNSSSGVKETPAFFCPTVNIGSRQKGRLRAANVLDAGYNSKEIEKQIRTCLFDEAFRSSCWEIKNPYGEGRSGERIAEVLAEIPLDKKLIQKRMMI